MKELGLKRKSRGCRGGRNKDWEWFSNKWVHQHLLWTLPKCNITKWNHTPIRMLLILLILLSYPCWDIDNHGEVSFCYSVFLSLLHLSLPLATSTKSFSVFISSLIFILTNIFCLCLPLAFFQLSLPQQPSSLSTCQINLNCLPMMLFNNSLLVLAFCKSFSFANFSTHCILNILFKNHISAASILFAMFLLTLQHSLPYVKTTHSTLELFFLFWC